MRQGLGRSLGTSAAPQSHNDIAKIAVLIDVAPANHALACRRALRAATLDRSAYFACPPLIDAMRATAAGHHAAHLWPCPFVIHWAPPESSRNARLARSAHSIRLQQVFPRFSAMSCNASRIAAISAAGSCIEAQALYRSTTRSQSSASSLWKTSRLLPGCPIITQPWPSKLNGSGVHFVSVGVVIGGQNRAARGSRASLICIRTSPDKINLAPSATPR